MTCDQVGKRTLFNLLISEMDRARGKVFLHFGRLALGFVNVPNDNVTERVKH